MSLFFAFFPACFFHYFEYEIIVEKLHLKNTYTFLMPQNSTLAPNDLLTLKLHIIFHIIILLLLNTILREESNLKINPSLVVNHLGVNEVFLWQLLSTGQKLDHLATCSIMSILCCIQQKLFTWRTSLL